MSLHKPLDTIKDTGMQSLKFFCIAKLSLTTATKVFLSSLVTFDMIHRTHFVLVLYSMDILPEYLEELNVDAGNTEHKGPAIFISTLENRLEGDNTSRLYEPNL